MCESKLGETAEILVRETSVGKGIFAGRAFPENAVICEITGRIIHDENYASEYCFDLGDDQQLEPDEPYRYVNHSCEPNCDYDYLEERLGDGRVVKTPILSALRNIMPGEELTIDYRWPASNAIPCCCGQLACRGWIVAEEELSELESL